MIKIETKRLELLPLDSDNLLLSTENFQAMEKNLGLSITDTKLDDDMQYAMGVRLRKVLADQENYLWLTNWAIILKEQNCIAGFIMIKGCPSKKGEVIVGYGIEEKYRCKGIASEAVRGLTEWIFKNPKAQYVIADTEMMNIASHKVLVNAGAKKYKEADDIVWWRICKTTYISN